MTGVKSFGSRAKSVKGVLGSLKSGLGGVLSLLDGLASVSPPLARLLDTFGKVAAVVSGVMTAINLLTKATPLGFVTGLLVPLAAQLIDLAVNSEAGQRIIEQVFAQVEQFLQGLLPVIAPVLEVMATVVAVYFTGYLTIIVGVLTVVSALLTKGFPAVRTAATSAVKALHGIVSSAWDGLKKGVKPVLTFLTGDLPKAFQRVEDAMTRTLNGIGEFITTGVQTVVNVMKAPLNGLIGFANWVIDGLNSIGFSILGKKFGVHLTKIPLLAEGGVVLPAACPRAARVLPLSDLDRLRRLSGTRRSKAADSRYRLGDFHESPTAGCPRHRGGPALPGRRPRLSGTAAREALAAPPPQAPRSPAPHTKESEVTARWPTSTTRRAARPPAGPTTWPPARSSPATGRCSGPGSSWAPAPRTRSTAAA